MTNWQPTSALGKAVYIAGFNYDPSQDIIYSRMDALQRHFGYAYGYDKYALLMSAAIDCEPIFFDYGGKTWMIELWKGQYGLETGCEIGVYNRNVNDKSLAYVLLDDFLGKREHDSNPAHNLFFDCANDAEMLKMSFTLYHNGQKLFSRGPELHWWLTGFKWGVYSAPDQLRMDISIEFTHPDMQNAFVNALRGMGYQNVQVTSNKVSFTFDKPKTYQPRLTNPLLGAVNTANQNIVNLYDGYHFPNNDPNTISHDAVKVITGSILQYEYFFGRVLNEAISELSHWLDIMSFLKKFKIMDFSCAVEFDNLSTGVTFVRKNYAVDKSTFPPGQDLGEFVVAPPISIPPQSKGRLLIQDNFGNHGGEGWVEYDLIGKNGNKISVRFSFGCPTGFYSNHVKVTPTNTLKFYAASGNGGWGEENHVPSSGHPLKVKFVYI